MRCKNLKQPTQTYIKVCYYGIVKNQLPEPCARWLILFSTERKVLPDGKTDREAAAFC